MDKTTEDYLHNQLIRLGDMIGDGLANEPDGKWINKEYRQTLKALGMLPKRKNNSKVINNRMEVRVKDAPCGKCQGQLKQARSGIKRATCIQCGAKWRLLK